MKKITVSGWKQGLEVQPLTLLSILREGLGFDLVKAKGLLDAFAEAGELVLSPVDDTSAAQFGRLAQEEGISVNAQEMEP